jgi:hypothetical protein
MTEQIYIGDFAKGLLLNKLPFNIYNSAFPTMFNFYSWPASPPRTPLGVSPAAEGRRSPLRGGRRIGGGPGPFGLRGGPSGPGRLGVCENKGSPNLSLALLPYITYIGPY